MIIQKLLYKMKNILSIILILLWGMIISCKKDNYKKLLSVEKENIITDTLKLIKDTTVFINSTEGENVKLFINKINKDSTVESEVLGEMGKSLYKFTFNKKLKTGECEIYKYEEPIYINSNPKIKSQKKEYFNTSIATKEKLNGIYKSYRKILITKSSNHRNNWNGAYITSLNENSEDWRNMHDLSLTIKNDSIIYEAKGYQLYQLFYLSGIYENNQIKLKFENNLDNTDSWALEKTRDFGTIIFDGKNYIWKSPYIDLYFNDGKKLKLKLKKLE